MAAMGGGAAGAAGAAAPAPAPAAGAAAAAAAAARQKAASKFSEHSIRQSTKVRSAGRSRQVSR